MLGQALALLVTVSEPSLSPLGEVIESVVVAAPGELGVAIEHLETGRAVAVRGDVSFPMASTFKLPLLVTLFDRVDQGKVRLDEMVSLEEGDIHIGSGRLDSFRVPGVALSVSNLAMLMMRISDNSAADKVLSIVGPEAVNAKLDDLGITGMTVERASQRLILDWLGMPPERTAGMTYEQIQDFLNAYKPAPGELERAAATFERDPRDSATPRAMNDLLRAIYLGRAASEESTARMKGILLECETGRERIPGRLPEGVASGHKTGTLGGTVNDVGVLYLPDGGGHVLLSILTRGVPVPDRDKGEEAIAEIARYAYDYFRFH